MKTADQIREHIAEFLSLPESFPLVLPAKSDTTQDFLNRRDARHERRKFLQTPEPVTGWGELS